MSDRQKAEWGERFTAIAFQALRESPRIQEMIAEVAAAGFEMEFKMGLEITFCKLNQGELVVPEVKPLVGEDGRIAPGTFTTHDAELLRQAKIVI